MPNQGLFMYIEDKKFAEKVEKILENFISKYGEKYNYLIDRYSRCCIYITDKNNIRIRYPSPSFKKAYLADNGDDENIDGMIANEIIKKHGLEVEYFNYTPEDMSTPLEEFYYIEAIVNADSLESKLDELKGIEDEIRGRYKTLVDYVLSLPEFKK